MSQVKDVNYNLDVIIEKLKSGVTMDSITNFYNVSEATIINDIKEYLKLKDANDIRNYIRAQKHSFTKPVDRTLIRHAEYYKGIGYNYSQFLEMLKKSNRAFSENAKLLAKQVFEDDKKTAIKDSNRNQSINGNDEIEM